MFEQSRPGPRREKKKMYVKKKVCRFCSDQHLVLSYRDPFLLRGFTTERGKIIPRRISGNCAYHQRTLTQEVKRARMIAFLPFCSVSAMFESA